MEEKIIPESELVVNEDGSIYHLHLLPQQIAETILLVGDPSRVEMVSRHFDSLQHKIHYREFITHTGVLNNKPLTVISTGIGTDNIDIVMNELDALVNIDLKTRKIKNEKTSLKIIRVGTSGAVDENIPVDSVLISETAIGMDSLLHFYEYENTIHETVYLEAFSNHIRPFLPDNKPYIAFAGERLVGHFENHFAKGTTITACGFYAPQGRILRAKNSFPGFIEVINKFRHKHFRITNLEMESAAIYGLGKILGHQCISVNAILANRINHTFSKNPKRAVERMIDQVLELLTTN